ncbi:MAG: hypothetical protein JNM30_08395 [Rhodospirillales bacterium]|nr:hypothetical protein [Rhodospirillales bacterium]
MSSLFTVAYAYRQQILPAGMSTGDGARLTPWRHGTMVVAAANAESARAIAGGRLAQLPGGGAYRLGAALSGIVIDLPAEAAMVPA